MDEAEEASTVDEEGAGEVEGAEVADEGDSEVDEIAGEVRTKLGKCERQGVCGACFEGQERSVYILQGSTHGQTLDSQLFLARRRQFCRREVASNTVLRELQGLHRPWR